MKRAFAVVSAVAIAATVAVTTSGAADTPASLHMVSTQISESGPHGRPHPGNVIVFSGAERGDDSGRSYVQCTLIDRRHGLCIGHWQLAAGTLSAQTAIALERPPKTITVEITGGTGAYDGARGTGKLTDIGKDKTDEVFTFKP